MKKQTLISVFVVLFASLLAVRCTTTGAVQPDTAPSAISVGDFTAPIEGCGNQPIVGYTYCVKNAGESSDEVLTFIAPPVKCSGDAPCVSFKLFFPDLSTPYGGVFPKGVTRVSVSWKTIFKRDTFEKGDRGFWPYIYTIKWIDSNGRDQETKIQGEIRLRVIASLICDSNGQNCKSYTRLNNSPLDPNFVWVWTEGDFIYKMTSGGRMYIGPVK